MKNIDLVMEFLKGRKEGKGSNLYIEDNKLINYNTIIAQTSGNLMETMEIVLNCNYYSKTTTKNQNYIVYAISFLRKRGCDIIVVFDGTEKQVEKFSKLLKKIS